MQHDAFGEAFTCKKAQLIAKDDWPPEEIAEFIDRIRHWWDCAHGKPVNVVPKVGFRYEPNVTE